MTRLELGGLLTIGVLDGAIIGANLVIEGARTAAFVYGALTILRIAVHRVTTGHHAWLPVPTLTCPRCLEART